MQLRDKTCLDNYAIVFAMSAGEVSRLQDSALYSGGLLLNKATAKAKSGKRDVYVVVMMLNRC